MTRPKDIAIIGAGKVGVAIGQLARSAGYAVKAVAGRTTRKTAQAARAIGPQTNACTPAEAARAGQLVLITVPDDAIETVCCELAAAKAFATGAVVAHCSGALGSDVLEPARQSCGCAVGSMHPLQTFPTVQAAIEKMPGTYFFCEGDETAVEVLQRLAADIGGNPVRIDRTAKAMYHAAAAMVSNHLVALLDAALVLGAQAGIDRQTYLAACGPLVRATVDNVVRMGPAAALTGPIARGDVKTIRRHLDSLGSAPKELQQFYKAAAMWTIQIALAKGTIDEGTGDTLRGLL